MARAILKLKDPPNFKPEERMSMTNWQPVSEFDPTEFEYEEFLVAVRLRPGGPSVYAPFLARLEPDRDENGNPNGEPRFEGEWRHVDEWKDCEPVAFAEIEPYEPDEDDEEEESTVTDPEPAAA
jgi:hypothetical protein